MKKLIDPLIKLFTTLVQALVSEPDSPRQFNTKYLIFVLVLVMAMLLFFAYTEPANADEWYVDVGAGLRIDSTELYGSDYDTWRNSRGPTAYFAVGYDAHNWRVELGHYSNWFIGPPLNDEPELHLTEIRFVKRFTLFRGR